MTTAGPGPARLAASATSFVGREREAAEVARLLQDYRLVTITGPGGVGKTRLAVKVAGDLAGRFPDGVHFVGLGAVADGARVPAEVAAALGVRQVRGRSAREMLTEVLAAQRLLLVLDNCEHVLAAAAELCGDLLTSADDVRILATSREQLWVGGEARYRLSPLALPGAPGAPTAPGARGSGEPADPQRSAAVTLFADRARQADPAFALTPESAPLAARVVARLDGMPLAIELAAARVAALGMAGLADRIDDALRLLDGGDVMAAGRHQSLTAVADWSYRLLAPAEGRVFRRLAVFPGPFTIEAAEAVAGPEAGPVVLRLVDCSLLTPPRPGPDQRMRYTLLETLRAYGLARLEEAGEEQETAAAAAGFALSVATRAAAGLETRDGEAEAVRWLDAENATLGQAVSWALEHDQESALRLTVALAPWWRMRGRVIEAYSHLAAAAARSSPASGGWARAQLWLGYLSQIASPDSSVAHYAAAAERGDARVSADALVGRASRDRNHGRLADAAEHAARGLRLSRQAGYPAGEAKALTVLYSAALGADAGAEARDWGRQAEGLLGADVPPWQARWCSILLVIAAAESGELDFARRVRGDDLARSREVGDLSDLTHRLTAYAFLERLSGQLEVAKAYLREAVDIAVRIGNHVSLRNCLYEGGLLGIDMERGAEALTLRAAYAADLARSGWPPPPETEEADYRSRAARALTPDQARAAAERGARMTLAAAAGLVVMLAAPAETPAPPAPPAPAAPLARGELTERERELITLVAQGRTNAEIADQLVISIRTVSSHLDRIRDKTGYRRRADLTRLALSEGLI